MANHVVETRNIFNSVEIPRIPRNVFNLDHTLFTSFDMADIVPIYVDETIPGDRWSCSIDYFLRFKPMTLPVLDRFHITFRAFAVPYRLLMTQEGYEKWIQDDKNSSPRPSFPQTTLGSLFNSYAYTAIDVTSLQTHGLVGTLWDYLGLPTVQGNGRPLTTSTQISTASVQVFPFRAYNFIYDEWFRNEFVQEEVGYSRSDTFSPGEVQKWGLRRVNWHKDYLTSALPSPQLGADVILPMGGSVPISGTGRVTFEDPENSITGGSHLIVDGATSVTYSPGSPFGIRTPDGSSLLYPNDPALIGDLSQAIGPSINELRLAFAVQRWKELNMRSGIRLPEWLLAHYHVRSSDARLQRPEYLGGFKTYFSAGAIFQNSAEGGQGLGSYAGELSAYSGSRLFNRFIEEQSVLMILAYVTPELTYAQGIKRFWLKTDNLDFADPIFGNLGEQEVFLEEVLAASPTANPWVASNTKKRFGFQSRYAEYKHNLNRVTGDLRSSTMDYTAARFFSTIPGLNGDFITSNPSKRIFNYTGDDFKSIDAVFSFKLRVTRSLPYYGTPSINGL